MKQNLFQSPIKIWYKVLPGRGKVIWPILDIKISYQRNILPQPVLALIDSGANRSIIHPLLAEALGFNPDKLGDPERGVSASGDYKSWTLPKMNINIYGYEFSLPFTVIDNKNLIWPCILGEDSIFQFARLDFQKFKGFLEIRFRSDIN